MSGRLALLRPVKAWLGYAALLSLFVNVLTLASPIYMLQVFDRVLVSHSLHTLGMLTVITVVMVLVYAVLDAVRARLLLRAGIALEQDLGPRVMERIHQFDPAPGQSGARAEFMRDVTVLRNYFSSPHLVSFFDSPWVPAFTLLIFGFSWVLGVITLVGMLVLMLLAWADEKVTYRRYTEAQLAAQKASQFAQASAGNTEVVHALGMRQTMIGLWRVLSGRALGPLKHATDAGTLVSGATKAARTLLQVVMLGMGAYLVIAENLSPGIMIVSTIIIARAIGPLEVAISGWRGFVEVRNSYARIEKVLQLGEAEVQTGVALPPIKGALSLEAVGFAFAPGATLLQNVSIKLEPGEALGLVGASGGGKSTLVRIILGLIRPSHGKVMLDGYDINHYDRATLGPQLGYLPQQVELFAGTVAQNICRMQEPEAHSAEIVRAGELLQLAPVIARLPKGFGTQLNENGLNLSGGQRQLVGLARALFGSPRLIVLDEPDANLDEQGQAQLIRLIGQIREARSATLIVVSHNPRIVEHMDRLLLVQDGTAKLLVRSTAAERALPGEPRKRQAG
jgi:ATP-binding cassette subfamily C exporter for protease/lipase